jgi:hypothetical protein
LQEYANFQALNLLGTDHLGCSCCEEAQNGNNPTIEGVSGLKNEQTAYIKVSPNDTVRKVFESK